MPVFLSFDLILSVKHTDDFAVEFCADLWIQIMQMKIQRVLRFGAQGNQRLSVSRLQQEVRILFSKKTFICRVKFWLTTK